MILDFARRALEKKPKTTFNELRRLNSISSTAEHFHISLTTEHKTLAPADLKFTKVSGKIDPNTIMDLEIEKS